MKRRASISVKILLLSFLNVVLLGLVFVVFVRVQYRADLSSLLLSPGRDRILAISRLIALELPETERGEWNRLLAQYASANHGVCYLFRSEGSQLAGPAVNLPSSVLDTIRRDQPPPFETEGAHAPRPSRLELMPPPPPVFLIKTTGPTRYWVGVRVPVWGEPAARPVPETWPNHHHGGSPHRLGESAGKPVHGTLVWAFSSLWTNPLLFDYKPWLAVVIVVILLSVACWLPLIRGLTRSISQLTSATGAIAQGRFETKLAVNRGDELGQLSQAINDMAERLSGFVNGQRRFLGDIAHELCSPIARIQVALGVLEQRAQDNQKEYVLGVQQEVEHMSGLINELLSFSKAGMNASTIPLTRVNVADTVRQVLQREAGAAARIETHIDAQLEVMAHPDYLFRSLANILRNAIRYAGDAGPIVVSASEKGGVVSISITDNGPGIPAAELEEVFKPFYRPEFARQRETGGVGLGLAIVKSCVEACGGTVQCRNRSPKGLEAEIRLPATSA
jgi:two-component system sensor histidine kinase CpxA